MRHIPRIFPRCLLSRRFTLISILGLTSFEHLRWHKTQETRYSQKKKILTYYAFFCNLKSFKLWILNIFIFFIFRIISIISIHKSYDLHKLWNIFLKKRLNLTDNWEQSQRNVLCCNWPFNHGFVYTNIFE